jgi:hypothetical protein
MRKRRRASRGAEPRPDSGDFSDPKPKPEPHADSHPYTLSGWYGYRPGHCPGRLRDFFCGVCGFPAFQDGEGTGSAQEAGAGD